MRSLTFLFFLILVGGCTTTKTLVLETPKRGEEFSSISIVANNPTVDMPKDITETFENSLRDKIYGSGKFERGEDLKLLYTFISYEEGDRFMRWFFGGVGGAGEGSVTILVKYVNINDETRGKTQVESTLSAGFLGGSINKAAEKAAHEVAEYTFQNFKNK